MSKLLEERKSLKKQLANCTDDNHDEVSNKLRIVEEAIADETAEENLKKGCG